jgi:hypothetical protein
VLDDEGEVRIERFEAGAEHRLCAQ